MQFSPYDWLTHIKLTVAGQRGVMKDVDLPLSSAILSGAELDGRAIVFDANNETAEFSMTVPRDFDEGSNELMFRMGVSHVSGTSISLSVVSLEGWRPGVGTVIESNSVPGPVAIDEAFGDNTIEIDLSAANIRIGDVVYVKVAASGRVGDGVAHLVTAEKSFRSYLIAHNRDKR